MVTQHASVRRGHVCGFSVRTSCSNAVFVAQSEEAKQRLKGPGLLIVDASPQKVSEDVYYVVETATRGLEIVEGTQLNGVTPCAQVLVCCRPPSMAFRSAATETASLLQL